LSHGNTRATVANPILQAKREPLPAAVGLAREAVPGMEAQRDSREESGQALVLTIVCLTLLMGMMALAVDQETFRCFIRGAPGELRGFGIAGVSATFLNAKR
jgi:hypothetical protein